MGWVTKIYFSDIVVEKSLQKWKKGTFKYYVINICNDLIFKISVDKIQRKMIFR